MGARGSQQARPPRQAPWHDLPQQLVRLATRDDLERPARHRLALVSRTTAANVSQWRRQRQRRASDRMSAADRLERFHSFAAMPGEARVTDEMLRRGVADLVPPPPDGDDAQLQRLMDLLVPEDEDWKAVEAPWTDEQVVEFYALARANPDAVRWVLENDELGCQVIAAHPELVRAARQVATPPDLRRLLRWAIHFRQAASVDVLIRDDPRPIRVDEKRTGEWVGRALQFGNLAILRTLLDAGYAPPNDDVLQSFEEGSGTWPGADGGARQQAARLVRRAAGAAGGAPGER